MAACESLKHIFENSLPEKPTLIESLSSPWNQMKPVKPIDQSSFVELFGELHFKEKPQPSSSTSATVSASTSSSSSSSSSFSFPMSLSSSSSSSSSSLLGLNPQSCNSLSPNNENKKSPLLDSFSGTVKINYSSCHKKSDSSSMNSESLQLCTEGLGSESFDDVENLKSELNEGWQNQGKKVSITRQSPPGNLCGEFRRSKSLGSAFPPPISCIGKSGKPWVCFKSYRQDGRFVLKSVRTESQEVLQACREGGRLKLQFVQPNDDIQELEDEDYESEEFEEDEQEEYEEIHDVADEDSKGDSTGN
ncbi:hypothetical protein ACOSP7_016094 [Xanthoceras sorbifolium]